ncbi:MAG TPA: hypothetical protein VFG76_11960 [Candidatus Polarisedimenticolia bacterium]|nr:hypothetical protein [Candidatus Polarisedimenticolia bacterium]
MKKLLVIAFAGLMVTAASAAFAGVYFTKLPKCSGKLCRDVGCSPDVLCASGTSVKTCAEVCGGK